MDSLVITWESAPATALEAAPRRDGLWKRWRDTYVGRAFLHPFHAVTLLALGAVAAGVSFWIALALVEATVCGLVPRLGWFRRRIDRRRKAEDERRENELRMILVAGMRDQERDEYLRLDQLATAIRARLGTSSVGRRALEEHARVERLLTLYARLAAAYAETDRLLRLHRTEGQTDEYGIDTEEVRAVRERRRAVREMRQEAARDNREALALLRAQLTLIADTVTLLFERAASPRLDDELADELEHVAVDVDDAAPLLHELAMLGA